MNALDSEGHPQPWNHSAFSWCFAHYKLILTVDLPPDSPLDVRWHRSPPAILDISWWTPARFQSQLVQHACDQCSQHWGDTLYSITLSCCWSVCSASYTVWEHGEGVYISLFRMSVLSLTFIVCLELLRAYAWVGSGCLCESLSQPICLSLTSDSPLQRQNRSSEASRRNHSKLCRAITLESFPISLSTSFASKTRQVKLLLGRRRGWPWSIRLWSGRGCKHVTWP